MEALLTRELALERDRGLVARAWLHEFTRRAGVVRPRLLARAFAARPTTVVQALPGFMRFAASALRDRSHGRR